MTEPTHGMSGGAWVVNMSRRKKQRQEYPDRGDFFRAATTTAIPLFPGGTWAAYLTAAEFNPLLQLVSNGCK